MVLAAALLVGLRLRLIRPTKLEPLWRDSDRLAAPRQRLGHPPSLRFSSLHMGRKYRQQIREPMPVFDCIGLSLTSLAQRRAGEAEREKDGRMSER